MELEAIRSRTKEALRARVRAGRIAGGRCFGYALKRETDPSGRPYTVTVVDETNARLAVSRIVVDTLAGLRMSYPKLSPKRLRELRAIRKVLAKGQR